MADYTFLPYAYLEKEFLPFASAKISVAAHALHYGTAAFGGLRGIANPKNPREALLFRLDMHTRRLSESARMLHLTLPAPQIEGILREFVRRNAPQKPFYIRPLVYTSDLGIAPRLHKVTQDFLMYGIELGEFLPSAGVSCRFSSWYRQEDRSLPLRGKISAAYITSSLAKTEAVESGFDEGILMNTQGKVCEATSSNLFMVRRGTLVTPSIEQDILEGITRASILTLARSMGIPVEERPIDKSELLIAEEVFLCGTAAQITVVNRLEGYQLPAEQPIAFALKKRLFTISQGEDTEFGHWVTPISYEHSDSAPGSFAP